MDLLPTTPVAFDIPHKSMNVRTSSLVAKPDSSYADSGKLCIPEGPLTTGLVARRLSATHSIRPSIQDVTYPPPPILIVPELPYVDSSTSSPTDSKLEEEERHVPETIRTKRQLWFARLYFAAQCFSTFVGGWNDSATVCATFILNGILIVNVFVIGPASTCLPKVLWSKQL